MTDPGPLPPDWESMTDMQQLDHIEALLKLIREHMTTDAERGKALRRAMLRTAHYLLEHVSSA